MSLVLCLNNTSWLFLPPGRKHLLHQIILTTQVDIWVTILFNPESECQLAFWASSQVWCFTLPSFLQMHLNVLSQRNYQTFLTMSLIKIWGQELRISSLAPWNYFCLQIYTKLKQPKNERIEKLLIYLTLDSVHLSYATIKQSAQMISCSESIAALKFYLQRIKILKQYQQHY